jgi:hypothetical protein
MHDGTNTIWLFVIFGTLAAFLVCGLLLHSREPWYYLAMIGAWVVPFIVISWPRHILPDSPATNFTGVCNDTEDPPEKDPATLKEEENA